MASSFSPVTYGFSPAVAEMPSVGSGNTEVHRRKGGGKADPFVLNTIDLVARENALATPKQPPPHDNASFPPTPRCRTSVRISALRHSSASPPCRTL
ncbi:hypothetical protein EDB84DRAFT_1571856 [Lactarius hengduanensis]|nr:hypothetical protein EDB84DRAFT_1571856 [Lactarius hengduanensis]